MEAFTVTNYGNDRIPTSGYFTILTLTFPLLLKYRSIPRYSYFSLRYVLISPYTFSNNLITFGTSL